MLQYAHPAFAAASHHYGTAADDPGARFGRALRTLLAMVFGDVETAKKHGRRVGRLHHTLSGALPDGTPWSADDPAALAWVLLTLIDAVVRGVDLALGRRSHAEVEAFLADARRFGRLFAVRDEDVPKTRAELDRAIERAVQTTLTVGPETRAMWSFLGDETSPSRRARARGAIVQRWTAATLPHELASALGRVPRALERSALLTSAKGIATTWSRLPPAIRFVTAARP